MPPPIKVFTPFARSFASKSTNVQTAIRKAQGMVQQWEQQADLSKGIANFYGAAIADKQFWPIKSNGSYPYYFDFCPIWLYSHLRYKLLNFDYFLVGFFFIPF